MSGLVFDNSFARLPDDMFAALAPTPVADPALIIVNDALAQDLGIEANWLRSPEALAVFAGNQLPKGAQPIAQLYAGHQFGQWNPQLGDGRAILLGEVTAPNGHRYDIQLKGSGPTPYSRAGDGRAWLGPVLREYLVSEAMAALGVPTTRALAAVTTGETIFREKSVPGAILTRIASSHLRVGTFQVYAARGQTAHLRALFGHACARHAPQADSPTALLDHVVAAQARLVAQWMGLGFIHGVMNTDNCSISGETIDYGPCAFMDAYHPMRVFSSIDHTGRYAYANQPGIAAWNCAQFATSLLPLMPDQDHAITLFTDRVNRFADLYAAAWLDVFGAKLGLTLPTEDDRALIEDLFSLMAQDGADFTNMFVALAAGTAQDQIVDRAAFAAWQARWKARRAPDYAQRMARTNPVLIPRNHRIEQAIAAATDGDFAPFHALHQALQSPFAPLDATRQTFLDPPHGDEAVTRTFCGT